MSVNRNQVFPSGCPWHWGFGILAIAALWGTSVRAEVESTPPPTPDANHSTRATDLLLSQTDTDSPTEIDAETDPERGGSGFDIEVRETNDLRIPIGNQAGSVVFGFGNLTRETTVLQGATRRETTLRGRDRIESIPANPYVGFRIDGGSAILLQPRFDLAGDALSSELTYVNSFGDPRQLLSIQGFNQQSRSPSFSNGPIDVDLPNGDDIWIDRLGTGVEYLRDFSDTISAAVGVSYQRIAARDGLFSSDLEPVDELGNPLTVDDDGTDTLLLFGIEAIYEDIDAIRFPTTGTRVRLGIDQAIPVGEAQLDFTRIEANFTHYIPLEIYQTKQATRQTLALNFQTGTFTGDDIPPYEAFNLGGASSVRGFEIGGVGTGASFIQASVELRMPVFVKWDTNFGFNLFVDYADDLGTDDRVLGDPAIVRGKPGSGLGYGLGVIFFNRFALGRIEFGWNDDGGSEAHIFVFGDRF